MSQVGGLLEGETFGTQRLPLGVEREERVERGKTSLFIGTKVHVQEDMPQGSTMGMYHL